METNRLTLRDRTRTRIEEMLTQSPKEQMAFFGFDTLAELEDKLIRVKKGLSNTKVDYKIFDLIEKASGKVIGSCGFHNWIKDHARAEIGYGLHKNFTGQGYMTEAMKQVLPHGFQTLEINRIEALIDPANLSSIKLVEQFGFKKEGILREHYKEGDQFEDSVVYSLLNAEYKAN